jgi:hypothetical protein
MAAFHIGAGSRSLMPANFTGSASSVARPATLLRLIIPLALLIVGLSVGSARQAHAAELVPFRATFVTIGGTVVPCGLQTICLSAHASGQATHLGRTVMNRSITSFNTLVPCSDVPGGTIRQFTDTLTLTAANGDTITMAGSGTSCANGIDVTSSGTYTVTGGTGRFVSASGTMNLSIARFSPDPEITTLTGTIASPGSLK